MLRSSPRPRRLVPTVSLCKNCRMKYACGKCVHITHMHITWYTHELCHSETASICTHQLANTHLNMMYAYVTLHSFCTSSMKLSPYSLPLSVPRVSGLPDWHCLATHASNTTVNFIIKWPGWFHDCLRAPVSALRVIRLITEVTSRWDIALIGLLWAIAIYINNWTKPPIGKHPIHPWSPSLTTFIH